MTVRSALSSLVIIALAFASIGGDCYLGDVGGPMSCGGGTIVMDGTTLTAQDTSTGIDNHGTHCGLAVGPVLYYKAAIPVGAMLTGKTTGPSSLSILPCGDGTCLASDADKGSGAGVTVAYRNTTSSTLWVILALGSSTATAPGTYGLTVSIK